MIVKEIRERGRERESESENNGDQEDLEQLKRAPMSMRMTPFGRAVGASADAIDSSAAAASAAARKARAMAEEKERAEKATDFFANMHHLRCVSPPRRSVFVSMHGRWTGEL